MCLLCASEQLSPTVHSGSVIYNVSRQLRDVTSGFKPHDVSLLYVSDRKLFTVTSSSGIIRLNDVPPHNSSVYSLAVQVEYQPNLSVVLLLCFKMATKVGSPPVRLITSGYREITVNVSENVTISTVLIRDLGSVVGVHGEYQYDIVSGNDRQIFGIDHVTGTIFTRAEMDYERCRVHRLVVSVGSFTEHTMFAVIVINVDDVNEYRPVFPVPVYRRTVFGSQTSGCYVTMVTATDQDAGRFGRLQYRPLEPTSYFVVDRTSGHVFLRTSVMVVDDVMVLMVGVLAEDAGGLTDEARVELIIRPAATDSRVPKFTNDTFRFQVDASATVGDVIGQLSLTGSESAVFSLRHRSDYFTVDRLSGRVIVLQDLMILSATHAESEVDIVY